MILVSRAGSQETGSAKMRRPPPPPLTPTAKASLAKASHVEVLQGEAAWPDEEGEEAAEEEAAEEEAAEEEAAEVEAAEVEAAEVEAAEVEAAEVEAAEEEAAEEEAAKEEAAEVDAAHNVEEGNVEGAAAAEWSLGMRVEAKHLAQKYGTHRAQWYPGHIASRPDAGGGRCDVRYDVRYDDGDFEEHVPTCFLRIPRGGAAEAAAVAGAEEVQEQEAHIEKLMDALSAAKKTVTGDELQPEVDVMGWRVQWRVRSLMHPWPGPHGNTCPCPHAHAHAHTHARARARARARALPCLCPCPCPCPCAGTA